MSRCVDCERFRAAIPVFEDAQHGKVITCARAIAPAVVSRENGRVVGKITLAVRKSLDPVCANFKEAAE